MIRFWLRETFLSIKQTQASFLLSLFSTTLAILLLVISFFVMYLTSRFDDKIKEDISMNLFLSDNMDVSETKQLEEKLKAKQYIRRVDYLSKDDAAAKFIDETGEDFRKLIDYNPLPASFEIYLKREYVLKDSLALIEQDLRLLSGVDEVYFNAGLYYKIIEFLAKSRIIIFSIAAALIFISTYLVFSTNKLILSSRYEEMNTMKLIGASLLSIKMPVILNSLTIGILSGLITFMVFFLFQRYVETIPEMLLLVAEYIILSSIVLGSLFGIITSIISLRKISLKI